MKIQIVTEVHQFERLSAQWERLRANTTGLTVFLAHPFLASWWQCLKDPTDQVAIALAREGDELIGALPMVITRGGFRRRGPKMARLMCWDVADYLDALVDRQAPPHTLSALWPVIQKHAGVRLAAWDNLRPEAKLKGLEGRGDGLGWTARMNRSGVCPRTHLAQVSWSKRFRTPKNLLNRLRREGTAELVEIAPAAAGGFLERFFALHLSRWENTSTPSMFRFKRWVEFYRQFVPPLMATRDVHCSDLRLNGRTISSWIAFRQDQTYMLYKSAYDPSLEKLSPGGVHLVLLLEWGRAQGIEIFDFLKGQERYKRLWTNDELYLHEMQLHAGSITGHLTAAFQFWLVPWFGRLHSIVMKR